MSDNPLSTLPSFLHENSSYCNFDNPGPLVTHALQRFFGWFMSRDEVYPSFRINGIAVKDVDFHNRADVAAMSEGNFNTAWTFWIDCARYMTASQHALVIEALVDGKIIGRSVHRCVLPRDTVNERDLVAFIHIPKSGGTSLRLALEDQGKNFNLLKSYDDLSYFRTRNLGSLSRAACAEIDAVYGHFAYGFHKNLPRQTKYVSLVRNPFDTIVSFYFFAKYELKAESITECKDIYEAIEKRVDPCLGNVVTRLFSGMDIDEPVTQESLNRAIQNVDHDFEFVGILEDLPSSLGYIGRYLGLNLVQRRDNITPNSRERSLLDVRELRRFAAEYIQYDLELYEYILKKFWGAGNRPTTKIVPAA